MWPPAIPVYWWSNGRSQPSQQWDSGMLHNLFDGEAWPTGFQFEEHNVELEPGDYAHGQAIVIVAARHHADDVEAINVFLSELDGVLLILLGDEEAIFPWKQIQHHNICFWVMMPHPIKHADMVPWAYFFGTGYRADTRSLLRGVTPDKSLAWVFAGQATHPRRIQAVDGLSKTSNRVPGLLQTTRSFTAGMERPDYLRALATARIAPCPSGPVTADSMRLYEALEAGCLPIVDWGPEGANPGYWEMVYGSDCPLIQTNDWGSVGGIIESELIPSRWPLNSNVVSAWWQQHKRAMAKRLRTDLLEIGCQEPPVGPGEKVTVIITTSPIPEHPSIDMLLDTMFSIDRSMKGVAGVQYIIACDGVRPEQRHLAIGYHEYLRHLCWMANHEWHDVIPVISKTHRHQAGMLKLAMTHVDTPLVLLVEHDAPFSSEDIDWGACINLVDYGALDILRFHHEATVHPEHEHLMLDHETQEMLGVPVRRTIQYSARPHLARSNYYRAVLERDFPDSTNCFIEDKHHGTVQHDRTMRHAIGIYHPEGTIRRTFHRDGRKTEPKFDEMQLFQ